MTCAIPQHPPCSPSLCGQRRRLQRQIGRRYRSDGCVALGDAAHTHAAHAKGGHAYGAGSHRDAFHSPEASAPPFTDPTRADNGGHGSGNGLALTGVRTAQHPGYDRVVFDLGGTGLRVGAWGTSTFPELRARETG